MEVDITIDGVLSGTYSDFENITGCTVFMFPKGAVCAAKVLGGAPGTRAFEPLYIDRNTYKIYSILFTGGSTFGLRATDGVINFLKEKNLGLKIDSLNVPVVPTAVIFDLFIGNPVAPSADDAYKACKNLGKTVPVGSFGAGCGAVVGKLFRVGNGIKSGQGWAEMSTSYGFKIGVFSVVNAFGDIVRYGRLIAGPRRAGKMVGTRKAMMEGFTRENIDSSENTTLILVVTDAKLNKLEAYRVATIAASGMSRVIDPVWTTFDGDLIVVASVGDKKADVNAVGVAASIVVEESILKAVEFASSLGNIPSCRSL